MRTSKASSTRAKTSAPTERDLLAALHADDLAPWSEEPLAAVLAERLGAPVRAVRALLGGVSVGLDVPGALVERLDETWLYRHAGPAPAPGDVGGVVAWTQLADRHAIVRTLAADAVERERHLRALHLLVGERPVHQLHRDAPAAPRRKLAREDRALLLALRRAPWAPADALASAAGLPARGVKERLVKLAHERALVPFAAPRAGGLHHVLVRVAPSSTAAARHALACLADATVRAWVPDAHEASLVDALTVAPSASMLERAAEVPGVEEVGALPITLAWRDEDALDALLRGPAARASAEDARRR